MKIFKNLGNAMCMNTYAYSLENNQNQIITKIIFKKQYFAKSIFTDNFLLLQLG